MIAAAAATEPAADSVKSIASATLPRLREALMTAPSEDSCGRDGRAPMLLRVRGARSEARTPFSGHSVQNLARALVGVNLPLDPLQSVVDRLRVAAELLGHLLVGRALEVQAQRVGLELREAGAEAEDEALQLLGRDHAHDRVVHVRARECVAEGALAVRVLARRRVAERDVAVQRRVLEAGRSLDRGDDLPRHAELGEGAERGLLVVAEVADCLVEADQPFLDEVLAVTAGEEVRARFQPDEAGVAADELIHRAVVTVARLDDELKILELSLRLLLSAGDRGWTGGGHCRTGVRTFAAVRFASAKVAPLSRNYKNSAKVPFIMDLCPVSAVLASRECRGRADPRRASASAPGAVRARSRGRRWPTRAS